MNFGNAITIGLKEIWSHKFRSLLTMFGIILGVSSLVAMSAVVKGMENGLREALVAMGGLEKIEVEEEDDLPIHQQHLADQAEGLTMADVYALQQGAPLLEQVTPSVDRHGWGRGMTIGYKGKYTRPYRFSGTWPSALEVHEHVVEHGRMFNELDDEEARSVCVIGTGIRDELFGAPEEVGEEIVPLGETISVDGVPFTIIGMFQHYESEKARRERLARKEEEKSTGPARSKGWGGGDHWAFRVKNKSVLVPLNTMLLKLSQAEEDGTIPSKPRLSTLNMKIKSIEDLEPALQQARNVLMVTHNGIEDFSFMTQEDWAAEITVQIRNARLSGGIIASICLIVGGIGIMNIMLASISERVREIGIRKAVGATTGAVFTQIIIESVVVAILGGVAGLGIAQLLVGVIGSLTPSANSPEVTVGAMAMAFGFSVLVGVVAGLFPALKASRLHPIQALRYD